MCWGPLCIWRWVCMLQSWVWNARHGRWLLYVQGRCCGGPIFSNLNLEFGMLRCARFAFRYQVTQTKLQDATMLINDEKRRCMQHEGPCPLPRALTSFGAGFSCTSYSNLNKDAVKNATAMEKNLKNDPEDSQIWILTSLLWVCFVLGCFVHLVWCDMLSRLLAWWWWFDDDDGGDDDDSDSQSQSHDWWWWWWCMMHDAWCTSQDV